MKGQGGTWEQLFLFKQKASPSSAPQPSESTLTASLFHFVTSFVVHQVCKYLKQLRGRSCGLNEDTLTPEDSSGNVSEEEQEPFRSSPQGRFS